MVAVSKTNRRLVQKVTEIYNWLDSQIGKQSNLAGRCDACGRCCDFKGFDHRLFVTTPELLYLAANVGAENTKPMTTNSGSTLLTTGCPYNVDDKCTVYKFRFAGCRIFCCKADKDFQSRLSEMAIKKFRAICEQFLIPYRYADLATALASAENTKDGRQKTEDK
jgi:Fe-S-cluster containining protein